MTRTFLLIVITALFAISASAQKITTDFDPAADFSQFHTYTWGEGRPAKIPQIDQRLVAGIESQLVAKGLRKAAPSEPADLIVAYQTATAMTSEMNTYTTGAWRGEYGTWPTSKGAPHTQVDIIQKGQLIVDLADKKTKKFVWRGIASGTVSDNVEKVNKIIDKALTKMFKDYPPKANR